MFFHYPHWVPQNYPHNKLPLDLNIFQYNQNMPHTLRNLTQLIYNFSIVSAELLNK